MSDNIEYQISSLNQQAVQLYQQGEYKKAISFATQVCDLARQYLEEEHPDYTTYLNNLAMIYEALGNYTQAETLYWEASAVSRRTLGENHLDYAVILSNLAVLLEKMGNYTAAEPIFQQALAIKQATLGENHESFARSLNNLAGLYYAMANYDMAGTLFQQALDIRQKILGENHPEIAQSLNNLAGLQYTLGNYQAAEPLYQRALEIERTHFGEMHPKVATTLDNLALLYFSIGDYSLAESLYQQSLHIRGMTLGENHPDFTQSLEGLAGLSFKLGRYMQAEAYLKQVVKIRRATLGEIHPDFARGLNNLAETYRVKGNYIAAEPLFKQAIEIWRHLLGENHPYLAQSIGSLASLYRLLGDYKTAIGLFQEALEIKKKVFGENHPDVAEELNSLAVCYHAIGNYRVAESFIEKGLEIRRSVFGEEHSQVAQSLNNLASFHHVLGNYVAAISFYQQALEIERKNLGENHPNFATTLSNLAGVYQAMGNYRLAESLYQQTLEIRQMNLGKEHPDFASSLNNLAALYEIRGRYSEAEPLYQQALAIRRVNLGEEHPDYAQSLSNLAVLYDALGNYTTAEPLHQKALEITRNTLGRNHPSVATKLHNLATLYIALGRPSEAMDLMEQATVIENQNMQQVFSIGSETQRLAYLHTLYQNFDAFLSLIFQYFSDSPEALRMGLELVLQRKAIGAQVLAIQRDTILGGQYPELRSMLQELAQLRMQIAQTTLSGPNTQTIETFQQLLREWSNRKERLETELARRIPEMSLRQSLGASRDYITVKAVADILAKNAVLVEFIRFKLCDFNAVFSRDEKRWKPARYLACVLATGIPPRIHMIDLGESEPIDRMIADFRSSITSEVEDRAISWGVEEFSAYTQANIGQVLRASIFDPLYPALDNCHHIFLAPDGDLTRLPFEILPNHNDKRLIDDYRISYLGVGRDVLRFCIGVFSNAAKPLIIADPNFDLSTSQQAAIGNQFEADTSDKQQSAVNDRRSKDLGRARLHFGRLPGTRKEGEQIAKMLSVPPVLTSEALESKLKAVRSPHILHIATHGFFLPDQTRDPNEEQVSFELASRSMKGEWDRLSYGLENPLLRSGLALAGANTWLKNEPLPPEAEDGILTAEDVSGLDLLATELVVLSACETGLGEVQVGEGVFGLRRAFMLAGAKTLVMSLWKVPDKQTQELMTDFYRRILAGDPRAEALRQAQLALKAKYPHPFYWGAFICQGEPGPLPEVNQ